MIILLKQLEIVSRPKNIKMNLKGLAKYLCTLCMIVVAWAARKQRCNFLKINSAINYYSLQENN